MRTPTRRVVAALAMLVAVAGLAACRTGEPVPEETPTPAAAATPIPSPTPTPEPPTPSPTPTPAAPAPEPAVNGTTTVTSPLEGEHVAGPVVTVTGSGTAFEATLSYRVLRAGTDEVVAEGWTTGGANGEVGPFTFDVELAPGAYVVEVWEPDMSDGAVGQDRRHLVQVTFAVG